MSTKKDPNKLLPYTTDLPHFTTMAEIDATEFFKDEGVNWQYCNEQATFSHKHSCEFIIHCGDADFARSKAKDMKDAGCTIAFIDSYLLAAASGAVRVLFYV